MRNEEDRSMEERLMEERLMNADAVEDAVLKYFDYNPAAVEAIAPERDLWAGIESRIGARVLALDSAPIGSSLHTNHRSHRTRRGHQWTRWASMAAAAAVLITGTASVTYVLTKNGGELPSTTAPAIVATAPVSSTRNDSQAGTPSIEQVPTQLDPRQVAVASSPSSASVHGDATQGRVHSLPDAARPSGQLASHDADPEAATTTTTTYDQEITTLRSALDVKSAQLDPATVATIEQNLRVIDKAIAQARSALAKDPKSRFLGSQLDRTLAKKTNLLRAAALLPSA